jgi:hypothetical protein
VSAECLVCRRVPSSQSIEQQIAYTAAETLAGADSFHPFGNAAFAVGLGNLEGRTPVADLQARLAQAEDKKVK